MLVRALLVDYDLIEIFTLPNEGRCAELEFERCRTKATVPKTLINTDSATSNNLDYYYKCRPEFSSPPCPKAMKYQPLT
jgi:hypothetical protein